MVTKEILRSVFIGILIGAAAILLALLLIWYGLGSSYKGNAKDEAEIKDVITRAVDKTHNVYILPQLYNSLPDEKIPDNIKQAQFAKITDELADVYSGGLLKTRIDQMQGAIEGQELQKFRVTDGGVKKAENIKIDVDEEKAYVEADIWTWVKFFDNKITINKKKTGISESGKHYTFILAKEEGKWKIISEAFNHLPGEEP